MLSVTETSSTSLYHYLGASVCAIGAIACITLGSTRLIGSSFLDLTRLGLLAGGSVLGVATVGLTLLGCNKSSSSKKAEVHDGDLVTYYKKSRPQFPELIKKLNDTTIPISSISALAEYFTKSDNYCLKSLILTLSHSVTLSEDRRIPALVELGSYLSTASIKLAGESLYYELLKGVLTSTTLSSESKRSFLTQLHEKHPLNPIVETKWFFNRHGYEFKIVNPSLIHICSEDEVLLTWLTQTFPSWKETQCDVLVKTGHIVDNTTRHSTIPQDEFASEGNLTSLEFCTDILKLDEKHFAVILLQIS